MNQRQKFADIVKERQIKLNQEKMQGKLVVLKKFREEFAHLLYPFQRDTWDIYCIQENSLDNPLQKILQAQCIKIDFKNVVHRFLNIVNIPQSLTLIIFPNLVDLHLQNNFISTIQPIHKLKAPLLQYLYLDENLITNVRSLRKCHFPRLWLLDLRRNPIPIFDSLAEMNIDNLAYLRLRYDSDYELSKWWLSQREINSEPLPSVLQHPHPDINFIFKNKSTCNFLYAAQKKSNSRKRQILRLRQLRA